MPLISEDMNGMATNGDDLQRVDQLADRWEEEYETTNESNVRPIRSTNAFNDITGNGFEFETNTEEAEKEKQELNVSDHYWTREEILSHLETNPQPIAELCEESDIFDERIKFMDTVLVDGVYKHVIREGTGDKVTENSAVLYNLNGYIEGQDDPFDSTWLRGKPNLHKLSYDTLLPGICMGLLTMRRGERSEIMVRPKYAYLEMGCPPRIPSNATILYIVEIIRVFEEGSLQHFETLSFDEKNEIDFKRILELCDEERISGNSYFKYKRYRESAFRYRRAIRCLEQLTYKGEEDTKQANELLLKLYVNIANTYNKFQKPFNAMSNCKRALIIDPNHSKAYYQYGLAKMANADYKEAEEYLKKALLLKPKSAEVNEALQRLDCRVNGEREVQEELFRKMGSLFVTKK